MLKYYVFVCSQSHFYGAQIHIVNTLTRSYGGYYVLYIDITKAYCTTGAIFLYIYISPALYICRHTVMFYVTLINKRKPYRNVLRNSK